MGSPRRRRFGRVGIAVATMAVATTQVYAAAAVATTQVHAATASGAPVLRASPASSADSPVVLAPGPSAHLTVVIRNTGRSASSALKASLARSPRSAAFVIVADGCTGRALGPKKACRVRVRYTSSVAPTADATAVLTVAGKRKNVSTTTYLMVRAQSAPVAADDSYSLSEDGVLTVAAPGVLANDTDPDGGVLTALLAVAPEHGSLILNSDGSFGYTPEADFAGSDSFSYRATDSALLTDLATVTLTVMASNDAPVADADVSSVREDTAPNPVSGNVLTNDADPDGDVLSVANAGTVTLDHGVLVIHADGSYVFTLDNSNPAVNALNDGQHLADTFGYVVSDGHGGTDSATLTVTINGTTD